MNLKYQKKTTILTIIAVFLIILDRLLKFLSINNFFDAPIKIIGNFFKLNFIKNYNIAFSLPINGWLLNITILIIILGLLYYYLYLYKKHYFYQASCLVFIIFGAISNLMDRIKFNYVIDYLDLKYFTVFNMADIMIVGGVIGISLEIIKLKKR